MEPAVAITEKSKRGEKKYLIKVFTKIFDQGFNCCLTFPWRGLCRSALGVFSSHILFGIAKLKTFISKCVANFRPGNQTWVALISNVRHYPCTTNALLNVLAGSKYWQEFPAFCRLRTREIEHYQIITISARVFFNFSV